MRNSYTQGHRFLDAVTAAILLILAGPSAQARASAPQTSGDVLHTDTGTLKGTLELPSGRPPFPVALIVAGSGPTDRNGNDTRAGLDTDCYELLADALARRGIASLRYDKRGTGASAGAAIPEKDMRFGTLIRDAVAWGHKLREDGRFSTLTVIGHSEGSLVGMVAARKIPAQAFVSLEGAGRPVQQVILEQLRPQLPPDTYQQAQAIIHQLQTGHQVSQVPPALRALLRPSVQPFLISWMHYNPIQEIARLHVPALIIQGKRDLQVDVLDAKALKNADPSAELVVIAKMNHVLKDVGPTLSDNRKAYADPNLPLDSALVAKVSRFILRVTPKRGSAHAR